MGVPEQTDYETREAITCTLNSGTPGEMIDHYARAGPDKLNRFLSSLGPPPPSPSRQLNAPTNGKGIKRARINEVLLSVSGA